MNRNSTGISPGVDWSLIWLYLLLVFIGITAIFAVTYVENDPIIYSFFSFKTDYSRQLYFFLIAGVISIFILLTDSKFFPATANLWYIVGIILLILVFPFHSRVKGTESIIRFGAIQFQPADFCKVFVALALAKYLSLPDLNFRNTRSHLIAGAIVLVPAIMTVLQSETGLALVYFAFFLVMYREGLPATILVVGFSLGALVVATLYFEKNTLAIILTVIAIVAFGITSRQRRKRQSALVKIVLIWFLCVGIQRFGVPFVFTKMLHPYQVERIYSTIGKDAPIEYLQRGEVVVDEATLRKKDSDYNVKQSKIAIGSGGITGKGLLKGTQTRYEFVPEQRTDFIFCTIGEGFGFIGTSLVLIIYLILLFRIIAVAERQRSVFSRAYGYGVAAVFFFHILINICMTIGLAPVIGIPLPFISYGGTSLLTFTILLFILIRLDADRQMVLR
ncbi:MAG TPA: rod shape-determining protein RodA [Flavisolibacter sp.]|nr:rod shape-determining protein RodA [Flavisolibacter sp.]